MPRSRARRTHVFIASLAIGLAVACGRFGAGDEVDPGSSGATPKGGGVEGGTSTGGVEGGVLPDGAMRPDQPHDVAIDGGTQPESDSGGPKAGRDAGFCNGGYVVFVSTQMWDAKGGVEAANAICREDGKKGFGLDVYHAWISDSAKGAIDRLRSDGPWCLPDGKTVAKNKAALKTGGITGPRLGALIKLEANGDEVPLGVLAWTGTSGSGQLVQGMACGDWTGNGAGVYGEPEAYDTSLWTSYSAGGCNASNRVVCFADSP